MNILSQLFSQPNTPDRLAKTTLSSAASKPSKSSKQKKKQRGAELKTAQELIIMRQSAAIVATVLKEIAERAEPGMTTGDLDAYAEKRIRELGATPSFKGYNGFPASICACINAEVVHGIPSRKKVIRAGDLLKIDTGAYFQGFHGDSCITIPIGKVSQKADRLVRVAEEAMYEGIEQVKAGNFLLDIAGAIEDCVKKHGYSVVEEFTGHGVGRNLHEDPCVFNFRTRQLPNVQLKAGMTLAIEPIVNAGSKFTRTLRDRWTVVTVDNALSAQFEHTVLVTATGYEILTDRRQLSQKA
jgi:methionyl aminopeptidase